MPRLKAHHHELLRKIVLARELPLADVDGRVIRPLVASGLVHVEAGRVKATKSGREAAADPDSTGAEGRSSGKLSAAQEDLLRLILRQLDVRVEAVDLRTARALRSRGLVKEEDGRLIATSAAGAFLKTHQTVTAKPKRGRPLRRHPRAEAILKAVEQLEHALPPEAEVLVGPIMCAADDVAIAFRKYARKLSTGQFGRES